jgi:DNA-binding LacI/PurR family transcriptional regulator/DNA-binding transcriptional regulator YhcF (GntR family)
MKRIVKPRAADLALVALRNEIESGRWGERLPGARVLANHLGVSAPTAAAALLKLAGEGLLERGGERCAFRVVGTRRTSLLGKDPAIPKRLLILSYKELAMLPDSTRRLIEKLSEHMTGKGWEVVFQVIDFLHVKRPQRSWDRAINSEPGTSVIAVFGRPALAEWAIRHKVRMFFLGGVTDGLPVSIAAVRSPLVAQAALARLTALGHWRIVLPLCEHPDTFNAAMGQVMKEAIEGLGRIYKKSYHNPTSNALTPDVIWRILDASFAADPPTALVFLEWKEFLTAQSYLMRAGLRIPEDVSVVLLDDQLEAEWMHPKLCRFRFPIRRFFNVMVSWLEDGGDDPMTRFLPADFVDGGTVAAPRPRK